MPGIDRNVPKRIIKDLSENSPHESKWSDDLKILLNPSIEAKPAHLPLSGQIKYRKNKDFEYFWAFDRGGENPSHDRVDQLRYIGFEFATTDDVEMMMPSTVLDKSEIRNGDRRLMKVAKQRWAEIRKSQMMDAIRLTSPRNGFRDENRQVMRTEQLTPGIKTVLTEAGDVSVEDLKSRGVESDVLADIRDGEIRGNKSTVKGAQP